MPVYEYKCEECGHEFERTMRLAEYRKREPQSCDQCHSEKTFRIFTTCNFNLVGDDWPGKSIRVNNQMATKNRRLSVKQNERKREEPVAKLVPNVDGERTDTWADAQKLAADKGKDTESYEPMVHQEKTA